MFCTMTTDIEPKDPAATTWHLDRRVPLALILAIGMQTAAGVWFAATMNQRLNTLEQARVIDQSRDDPNRITRLETKVEGVQRTLDKLDLKMDRVIQGPGK